MGQSSPLVEHSARESVGLPVPVCTSPSNVMNSSTDSVLSVGTPPITPPYSRSKTPTGPATASLQPSGGGGGVHRVSVSGSAAGTPGSSSGRGSKTSESDAAASALLAATELSASTSTISTLTPENSEGSFGTLEAYSYYSVNRCSPNELLLLSRFTVHELSVKDTLRTYEEYFCVGKHSKSFSDSSVTGGGALLPPPLPPRRPRPNTTASGFAIPTLSLASAASGHHLSPPPSSPPAIASPRHAVSTATADSESIARPVPIAATGGSPDAPPLPPRRPRNEPSGTEFSFTVPDEPPHTFMNIRSNHDYYSLLPLSENVGADSSPRASAAAIASASAPVSRSASLLAAAAASGRTMSSQENKRGSFYTLADVNGARAAARTDEKSAPPPANMCEQQQQQLQPPPPPRPPKSGRSPSALAVRNSLPLEALAASDEVPPPTPPRLPPRNKGTASATMFVFSAEASNAMSPKRVEGIAKHPALASAHSVDASARQEKESAGESTPRPAPNRPPPLPPPRASPAQSLEATAALLSPTAAATCSLKAHSSNSLPREATDACALAADSSSARSHSSQLLNPFDDLLTPAVFSESSSSTSPESSVPPPESASAPIRERDSSSPGATRSGAGVAVGSGADAGLVKREHNLSLLSTVRSRTPQPGAAMRATPQLLQLGQRVGSSLSMAHGATPRASPLAIVVESETSRAAREQHNADSSSSSTTLLSLSPNSTLSTPAAPESPSSAQASPLLDRTTRRYSAFRSVSSRGSHHKSHRRPEAAAAAAASSTPPHLSPSEASAPPTPEAAAQSAPNRPLEDPTPASEEPPPPPPPPRTYRLKSSKPEPTST